MRKFLYNVLISKIYRLILSIRFKMKPLEISATDKCLILAPHPDDESIGCGGLILKYPDNCDVICLTDGQRGSDILSREETIKVRKEEFKNAMEYAKVNSYSMLDIPDNHLADNYQIFEQINTENYDYIFIPNILDQHIDHKALSLNLNKLLKSKKHKKDLKIVMYEVWSSLPLPNCYLDIDDIKEKKKELINFYKSQIESLDYTGKIIALNSYRGLQVSKNCIEAYMMVDIKTLKKMVRWIKFI